MNNSIIIREVTLNDASALCEIFNYYVETSPNTFETIPMTIEKMVQKITLFKEKNYPFIVLIENEKLRGYTYLGQFRAFTAYDITAELAIFLEQGATQKGYGKQLIESVLNHPESQRFHSIISAITASNEPSCKLHERLGFQLLGIFPEVGFKHGKYQAVHFYQYIRKGE